MGGLSWIHILLFAAIALVLFGGGGKIPRLMKDLGQGITAFKKGLKEEKPADSQATSTDDKPSMIDRS
ncbi:MAG TPA: twin-arginine translocase TatA/TatE family subunit [Dongiaceae bacterium]|nr:twin-arginine translocase TatA/TatE family subunit [Dongiaceae bacterium]